MSNKKTILICIDWFYPGYRAGGPVRSVYNLIQNLDDDYNIKIVTRNTDYCSEIEYKNITPNKWIKKEKFDVIYLDKKNQNKSAIKRLVKSTTHDVIYVNGIYSRLFTLLPLRFSKSKKIVSVRGMLSKGSLSVKPLKKKIFLFLAKKVGIFKSVIFHVTTEEEKSQTRNYFKINEIIVAQNLPSHQENKISKNYKTLQNPLKLINISRIAPEKNILFSINCLKKVSIDMIYDIYGPTYNETYLSKCIKAIATLPKNIKVNLKGEINPFDIPEVMENYHFLFMPTSGENYGHTIVEAFSNKLPVIISDKTPWINLTKNKCGYDLALDENVFSNIINQIPSLSIEEYREMQDSSLNYFNKISQIDNIIKQYKLLFG